MSDNKFKQFWLYEYQLVTHVEYNEPTKEDKEEAKPGHLEIIHVVEYAELSACEAKLESANAEIARLQKALERIASTNHGKDCDFHADIAARLALYGPDVLKPEQS